MKKIILISLALALILLSGCPETPDSQESAYYKGIESAPVPEACVGEKDDVCGLFDCMVDLCWCKEGPKQVLLESQPHWRITSSEEAVEHVQMGYINTRSNAVEASTKVLRAVELNNVFYNVFAETLNGEERVFTVAKDGTIIQTVCGV